MTYIVLHLNDAVLIGLLVSVVMSGVDYYCNEGNNTHCSSVAYVYSLCWVSVVYLGIVLDKHTVRCRYNVVDFPQHHLKWHPIAHPLGRGMGCLLWVQAYIHILSQSSEWCVQFHVILDRVITTLDCILQMTPDFTWSYSENIILSARFRCL